MDEAEIKTMAKALAVAFVKMKLVEFLEHDAEQQQNDEATLPMKLSVVSHCPCRTLKIE